MVRRFLLGRGSGPVWAGVAEESLPRVLRRGPSQRLPAICPFLSLAADLYPRPTSPTQEPTSTLRKILPAMPKTNLRENIYTIPNILTASRLVAAPFIGYCILHDYHALTLGLFAYAGITDALDGWIARRWNLKTVVGTIIDPMADKTLMTVLTVALAVKGALPGMPTFCFPWSLRVWAPLT